MRIFIAEDDRISMMMLEAILQKNGYEVVAVDDGGKAMTALSLANAPRLVILDVNMPVMDGLEVCRKMRLLPGGDIPYIIMLTTSNRPENVEAGLAAGANDYVGKPFVRRDLLARVRVGEKMIEMRQALETAAADHLILRAEIDRLNGLIAPNPFTEPRTALERVEAGRIHLWAKKAGGE